MTLPWRPREELPKNLALCLVVINDKIVADVFVFHKSRDRFVGSCVYQDKVVETFLKRSEVKRWLYLSDVTLPEDVSRRVH
jgi:hypothetical protein